MKFGLLIDTELLKRATSPNWRPEVKLRLISRLLENQYSICAEDGPIWTKFGSLIHRRAEYGDMVKIESGSRIPIWRMVVFPNRK